MTSERFFLGQCPVFMTSKIQAICRMSEFSRSYLCVAYVDKLRQFCKIKGFASKEDDLHHPYSNLFQTCRVLTQIVSCIQAYCGYSVV